ncbi:hypothetical protein MSAN_00110400 [Mycena sanguinolenta]|uniref:Transmembrane protein n=1 Tax=Mycena sanguinolenta TaxID=230812 RepID=A0A8H6ZII5_9AGAR|nr:hypothetical protein MSAN_00110400 [Mycena sanguinolenta]
MSTPPRQRVVDDTDPAIQYGPNGWFIADPSTLNVGNFGPIYQDSSHATTSNANLTFPFNGTAIQVLGTIYVSTDPTTNATDPTWDCFVDDIAISNPNPTFKYPENNWLLCEQAEIAEGSHVLTIQVQSKGHAFYFDYLKYTPPLDTSFDTAVLLYPNTDPSVSFGSGWSTFGGENGTNDHGSQTYSERCTGTSVVPYGFVPTELPHNATWATYTIDGGQPVNFTLNGLSSPQSATEYFVPLFTTPTIPNGAHNLVITYGGDSQHTPLVIQGFYVTNTTTVSSDSSSPSSSASTPSASPSSNSAKHTSAGAIAGGVIGGIIVLALLAALAFFYAKRRRRRRPDLTSANPYPMSMADDDSHVHSLPPTGADTAASSSGSRPYQRTEDSRPSTDYPYIQRAAPLHHHPSDTMSSSRGTRTHTQQPSASSASQSHGDFAPQQQHHYNSSTSAVVSHDSAHGALPSPATTPPAAPLTKLERERAAAAPTTRAGDVGRSPGTVVVIHEDSGLRLPSERALEPRIVELPPGYSPD